MPAVEKVTKASGAHGLPLEAESGAVLVLVLLTGTLLAAMAMMMLTLTDVEVEGAGRYRDGEEALYAADGALEAAIDELAPLGSWTPVLSGSTLSRWTDSTLRPYTPLAGLIDLPAMSATLQSETNGSSGLGADTPVWRLFMHERVSAIWPDAGPTGEVYLAVWVGDDDGEADGNPWTDSNDVVQLRAEAYGRRQSRRMVEAVIGRTSLVGVVRQIAWREVR